MKSYAFLFWAYNVFWGGLALYVLFLTRRLGHVGRRLDGIERELIRREAAGQASRDS